MAARVILSPAHGHRPFVKAALWGGLDLRPQACTGTSPLARRPRVDTQNLSNRGPDQPPRVTNLSMSWRPPSQRPQTQPPTPPRVQSHPPGKRQWNLGGAGRSWHAHKNCQESLELTKLADSPSHCTKDTDTCSHSLMKMSTSFLC